MSQFTERENTIVTLLRRYRDLEGVSKSGTGGAGKGDRVLYDPDGSEWETSGCDALDDLLTRLRGERPVQWWHVTERYLRCDIRSRRVKAPKGRVGKLGPYCEALGHGVRPPDMLKGGEVLVVVEEWVPQVRLEKVRHGVTYLSKRFPWQRYRWRDLMEAA